MPIRFNRKKRCFQLYNKEISYIIHISQDKKLIHLYFGPYLKDYDVYSMAFNTTNYDTKFENNIEHPVTIYDFNSESASCELGEFGIGDFRSSSIKIKNHFGDCTCDFKYTSHQIFKGKETIDGLPAIFGTENDFTTLKIKLKDYSSLVEITLVYCICEHLPILTRYMEVNNTSKNKIELQKAYSACLDFKTINYKMVYLAGRYGKERTIHFEDVQHGIKELSSLEGKSSHHSTPFIALTSKDATEEFGEVFSINLIYSGNFSIKVEADDLNMCRLLGGINPETFNYCLLPNDQFITPEIVLLYTNKGLGEMSRIYHNLFNHYLISPKWQVQKRPLLLNSWEGCYFDFNTEKLMKIIDEAHDLGIEMLVIDDGWFGKRNDDSSSLGDWFVNQNKIDLHQIIQYLHHYNMKLGLWFEPEMISPKSQLFKNHPEYAIQALNRKSTLMRHQMVLNMSKEEVVTNIIQQISAMLEQYQIDYIKWDHNRSITEAFSQDLPYEHMGEFYHRFILGTYKVLKTLNERYPNVLIESCCAGGGRYDAGMLYFSPQIWTSDETDPIERLTIQEGTSLVFPCSSMGAHVTANSRCNYQFKGHVAMMGTFGYELNPLHLNENEKNIIRQQIKEYHRFYDLTHYGNLYRLISPSSANNYSSWMFVSEDKKEALFTFAVAIRGNETLKYIRLKGLNPNKYYYCEQLNKTFYGQFLMQFGLNLTFSFPSSGQSLQYYFKQI